MKKNHQPLAFLGATLIDGCAEEPIEKSTVLVADGNIQAVGKLDQISIPADAHKVDVSGMTIMPGMIDCHLHISDVHPNIEKNLFTHPTLRIFKTAEMMRKTLHAGFTTIRDAGSLKDPGFRQAVELGLVEGPRLVLAGAIGQTGGHFDEYYPSGFSLQFFNVEICDGIPEVQKAVRKLLRDGMDFIKVCTTGGVVSPADSPDYLEWTLDELKAAVYEAKARGKAVMSHSCGAQGIKNAVLAGIWSVEHGSMMDEEAADMMKQAGTYFVPTMFIVEDLHQRGEEMGLTEVSKKKLEIVRGINVKSFQLARSKGIKIATGSDCIDAEEHGRNAVELELFVRHGMTPMQAIVAATRTAAEVCRVDHRTGTLLPGKLADLLVLRSNPLDNIALLQDPLQFALVMKDGKSFVNSLF